MEQFRTSLFDHFTGEKISVTPLAFITRAVVNALKDFPNFNCSIDPEKNKDAVKFKKLTYDEAINKKLKIMDSTAFTLSQENNLPIIVFNMNKPGNLKKIIEGKDIGTTVN